MLISQLLKLNIYQEGDFFVPHKDTPLSEDSIGSLVIALPVAHRGGHLKVSHRDCKHTFKFDQHIAPPVKPFDIHLVENIHFTRAALLNRGIYPKVAPSSERYFANYRDTQSDEKQVIEITSTQDRYLVQCGIPEPKISYAAFYGDCIHEIEHVTMGMRLTLSYQLIRCSNNDTSMIQRVVDPNTISISRCIHDPELAELTRLILAKPKEMELHPYLKQFSTAILKYLVFLADKYGATMDHVKLNLITQLTQLPDPKLDAIVMPPLPSVNPMSAWGNCKTLCKVLIAALHDQSLADCYLGFPCYHLYESEEELPKALNMGDQSHIRLRLNKLRGADALLCLTALQAGFQVELLRIVSMIQNESWSDPDDSDDDDSDDDDDDESEVEDEEENRYRPRPRYGDDEGELYSTRRTLPFPQGNTDDQHTYWEYKYHCFDNFKQIRWLRDYKDPTKVLRAPIELMQIAEDSSYFGNEASAGYVYAQCGIVIHMPAWNSLARLHILNSLLSDEILTPEEFQGIPSGYRPQTEKAIAKEAYELADKKIN